MFVIYQLHLFADKSLSNRCMKYNSVAGRNANSSLFSDQPKTHIVADD